VSGSLVSPALRARVRGVATPIAIAFGRLGLTPNHLTLIGFAIAVLAAVFASGESWVVAGVLLIVGGVFDLFDGALARATGTVSQRGAFMDSVFDRAGEAIVYLGIMVGCISADFRPGAILAAAAMAASFMVSYIRAKSEGLGFTSGSGMAAIGLAPREVRIVILTVGLLLTGLVGGLMEADFGMVDDPSWDLWFAGRSVLTVALGLVTALATITTIQRIVHVTRQSPQE
jgi:archaetidylinositol phosphate synthase